MNRLDIEATAARATYLRGLLALPLGLFFALNLGLFRLIAVASDAPPPGVQVIGVVLLVGLELLIRRFYRTRFGTARRRRLSARHAAAYVLLPVLLASGVLLDLRSHGEVPSAPWWMQHLSATTLGFGLGTLLWYRLHVGVQCHHLALWGGLSVLAVLPVWGRGVGAATTTVVSAQGFLLIGAALVMGSVLDHRMLVASLPPQPTGHPEHVEITP
jgi:hypothetical protein